MKKIFTLLLAFLSVSLVWADEATVTYTFSDGTTSVQNDVTTISSAYSSFPDTYMGIVSVEVEGDLESIGSYAFLYCSSLTTFSVNGSVGEIKNYAFDSLSSLTTFSVTGTVGSFGSCAFANCYSLNSVTFSEESPITSISQSLFSWCSSLTSFTIPSTVTKIENLAFRYCSSMEEVTCLATEPPTLGSLVFSGISETAVLYVPAGTISAYTEAGWNTYFANIYEILAVDDEFTIDYLKYKILTLDDNNSSYTVSIVGYTNDLPTELEIPSEVNYDYYDKTFTVTEISDWVFQRTSITTVFIPNTITTTGAGVFLENTQLTTVTFEEGSQLASFEQQLFNGCTALETIEIPSSVTSIGYATFNGCTSLKTVTFEENSSLETIVQRAFYECTSLTKIEIPTGCETIKYLTFKGCTSLTSIKIPSSVTSIGKRAFNDCSSLENVTLPATASIGESCFEECSLTSLTITGEAMTTTLKPTDFDVEENSGCVLNVTEGLEHEYYEAGWGDYFTINNYIEGTTFDDENGLTYEITDQYEYTVKIVAFECSESVTIPASITYNDVEYTITAVADGVFNCSDLMEVTMVATEPPFDASVFENIAEDAVLIVPEGAKEAYSSWSDSFIEILDGTESSTALININSDKKEIARYNLLGQKITTPQQGINIVKYSDGTVEKVLVK